MSRTTALALVGTGLLLASATAIGLAARYGGEKHDAKLAAVAASVSAEEARWNAEHHARDASDEPSEIATASEPPIPADEDPPGRDSLAKLAANPRAFKPKTVTPADADHSWTTYEYEGVTGLGDVTQNRWAPNKWELFLPHRDRPEAFAPEAALKPLDHIGPVQWWRVTSGPFRTDFIMRSPGGISLLSLRQVCDHEPPPNSPAPKRDHECGY